MYTAAVVMVGVGVVILMATLTALLVLRARRRDRGMSPQDRYRRDVLGIKKAAAGGAALGLWGSGPGWTMAAAETAGLAAAAAPVVAVVAAARVAAVVEVGADTRARP